MRPDRGTNFLKDIINFLRLKISCSKKNLESYGVLKNSKLVPMIETSISTILWTSHNCTHPPDNGQFARVAVAIYISIVAYIIIPLNRYPIARPLRSIPRLYDP